MGEAEPRETLGMTEEELQAYFDELLRAQAVEVAAEENRTPAQVMASTAFVATRAATSYAVQLIAANNAYLSRHLLDLGVLPHPNAPDPVDPAASADPAADRSG